MSLAKRPDFLPFSRPEIHKEEQAAIQKTLESLWLSTGPRVTEFESMLRAYLDTQYAITMTSATASIHLALLASNIGPGDEVITTPLTWFSTAHMIMHVGATPVFADIDPLTLNIDIDAVANAITKRTKAILPVHFAGLPCDIDALYSLAKAHNLVVIEDAAHAIGSSYKGKKIGSEGYIQTFSFHPNKNITTGEGGCLSVHDEELANRITAMRFHGINRDAFSRYTKKGSHTYDVQSLGFKYNLTDIQASLGCVQLPKLDTFIEKRAARAARYQEAFSEIEDLLSMTKTPSYAHTHAHHLFTIRLNTMPRADFIHILKNDYNIGVGIHYNPLHTYALYRNMGFCEGQFPHAEKAGRTIVSLPLFPSLSINDQDYVIDVVKHVLKKETV